MYPISKQLEYLHDSKAIFTVTINERKRLLCDLSIESNILFYKSVIMKLKVVKTHRLFVRTHK